MKKPTSLPPPIPKPRPPPKPKIPPKSVAKICTATGKPIVPPKPNRRTPPSIPTNNNIVSSEVQADLADDVPKRPLKPSYLSSETSNVQNDIESKKSIPDQDILDHLQADDLYDDVNIHPTSDPCTSKPQLPEKPPLKLSEHVPSSSLTVRPTPSPRLSPHASPTPSPRSSPYQEPPASLSDDSDIVQPSPRPRALAIKDGQNNAKVLSWKKPEIPPKPIYLQKIYNSSKVKLVGEKNTEKTDAIQEQIVVTQHIPECTMQDNQSEPVLPILPPKRNSLEISEECNNSIYKSPGGILLGGSNTSKEAVKKRIASRRQLNPHNVTRMFPVDARSRRPPPPPPTNTDGSPKKRSPLKGPPVSTDLDRLDEAIPKTAEEQSLYSYAYEHTVVTATMPSNCPHPQGNQSEDNSYVEPDASAVNIFMDELKNKEAISSGQYEIPAEDEEEDNTYVEPDASAVNNLIMEELNNKEAISSGLYEIPTEDGQEDIIEQAHETESISSTEYTFPDQIIFDDHDDHGSSVESSNSEEYHEYEYPVDSPPPVPPHRNIHSDSYDINPFKDEMLKDDDDDVDDDDDDDGEYVEPPDAQGSSEEDSDEDAFWGDDDESVEEPLYQIYAARTLQKDRTLSRKRTSSDQQTETFIDDLTKGTLRNMRMLWCEIPEIVSSGILDTIDPEERKRQEAMFEVITSEASYLKSINILESHFINSLELTPGTPQSVLEKAQHHILFSNVRVVVETSQMFLEALRKRQKESLVISSISDIIEEFATKYFEVYIKYCSNQLYQDRVLKELSKDPRYVEGIQRLERCSTAQCLSMHSFLVLPMQRITRLPLLVDAICHRCEPGSDEFVKTDAALKAVNKIVQNCNEGARKMERIEEMVYLQPQIEFTIKPIVLVTTNRWLLRRGEVVLVIEQSKNPLSKKKLKLKPVYMFLFNDLLLITKKKGERRYRVLDYAARHMTKVEESTDPTIQLDYMLSLILLENSIGKTKDFILCAESETDKTRWLEAFNPPKGEREGEKVYGAWDCPQVQVIHDYTPQQPDELALHEGDVINVQRKLTDGWYYGERLCDGVCGWFPANYTENIRNEHVRARNLLQRYRLLAASKHLFGAVQTMKPPKTSKLTKGIMKRDTIS